MTESWGVDITLKQDRKGVLLYLSCDSKLFMFFSLLAEIGENAFLFQ